MFFKLGEFLKTITDREIRFLIVGLIIGFLVHIAINNIHGLKIVIKKPTESILTICITIVVFLQIFNPSVINSMAPNILNFISTMAFSWIMTKYSVRNDYEHKQKELASLSYKHSVGIKNKLEYTKNEIENYIGDLESCWEKDAGCKLKSKLENVKSQILYVYQDSIDNLNDWANAISEDIRTFEETVNLDNKIEEVENEIDELNSKKEKTFEAISKLKRLKIEKQKLLASINLKVFHAIKVSKEENLLYNQNIIKEKISRLNKRSSTIPSSSTGS